MREQMQALQRKLVRVVTENEALRHVVDKLQCSALSLRRQLQRAGMALDGDLDEALLRPAPHQVHPAGLPVMQLGAAAACGCVPLLRACPCM